MMDKKTQQGGDSSTNIQAETFNNIVYSLNYSEIREIFIDLFELNMTKLKAEAKATAENRANEIIDGFVAKLSESEITDFSFAREPRFQESFFNAQKAYALSGEENNRDIIIDMLDSLSQKESGSNQELVTSEALKIMQKLTYSQIATLTLLYMFRHLSHSFYTDYRFEKQMNDLVSPFVNDACIDVLTGNYLQFTGCLNIYTTATNLDDYFIKTYSGFTKESISREDVLKIGVNQNVLQQLFRIEESEQSYSFIVSHSSMLSKLLIGLINLGFINEDVVKLIDSLYQTTKNKDKKVFVDRLVRNFPNIYSLFTDGLMKYAYLTPVGKVIAYYNFKRKLNLNLSVEQILSIM